MPESPTIQSTTRLRVVPSQGRSWHSWDRPEAIAQAAAYAAEYRTSVAVCLAPEDGLVTLIRVLKPPRKPKKAAKA